MLARALTQSRRSPDIARRPIKVIWDSALDGCEKVFRRSVADSWAFEAHRGAESLTVACNGDGK